MPPRTSRAAVAAAPSHDDRERAEREQHADGEPQRLPHVQPDGPASRRSGRARRRAVPPAMMTRKPTSDIRPGRAAPSAPRARTSQRRPVALDAVDAVGAALDLAHRGGERDDRDDEAGPEGELAAVPGLLAAPARGSSSRSASVLPGVMRSSTSRSTRPDRSAWMVLDSPMNAMPSGISESTSCSASAREWLKPSPYRNRTKTSLTRCRPPVVPQHLAGVVGRELVRRHRAGLRHPRHRGHGYATCTMQRAGLDADVHGPCRPRSRRRRAGAAAAWLASMRTCFAGEPFHPPVGHVGPAHHPAADPGPVDDVADRDDDDVEHAVVRLRVGQQRDVALQLADVADHDGADPAVQRRRRRRG